MARTPMAATVRFCLKVSRPGLWFPTVWLYLLPLGGRPFWEAPAFWAGLLFVTFPLNFLVYGLNDRVDQATDRQNPRKDTFLFGARGDDAQLARLPRQMVLVTAVGFAPVIWWAGPLALMVLAGIFGACMLYNHPRSDWRSRPPLELICQVGYLLVVPLSVLLNDAPWPPAATWVYLALFALQAQLMGEVMDVDPDRAAGRRTTATQIGVGATKLAIIAVVAAEAALVWFVFADLVFAAGLALFIVWLLVDRFVLFGTDRYTLGQMKLFGVGSNVVAAMTMVYAWHTGCLLR